MYSLYSEIVSDDLCFIKKKNNKFKFSKCCQINEAVLKVDLTWALTKESKNIIVNKIQEIL